MRTHRVCFPLIAALAGLLSGGCGKDTSSAPAPLAEEQIPSVIAQTFSNSNKETQEEANQYVDDVKSHNYPAAFEDAQKLAHQPGLTHDQRATLARALRTTSQKLQDAAASGDNQANQVLNDYSASK